MSDDTEQQGGGEPQNGGGDPQEASTDTQTSLLGEAQPAPADTGNTTNPAATGDTEIPPTPEPTDPEPPFPDTLRFESGHPDHFKDWLKAWLPWYGRNQTPS
jgi:hypothetical protein